MLEYLKKPYSEIVETPEMSDYERMERTYEKEIEKFQEIFGIFIKLFELKMTKAIYIGAGADLEPVHRLENIAEFIHIDGQPNSEFGTKTYGDIMSNGCDGFSRPRFIPDLERNMEKIGMVLRSVEKNLRIYSNRRQEVKYYTNTAIPEHYGILREILSDADTLIISRHDPDSIFLDGMKNKLHFIGFSTTYFGPDEIDNPNSITARLNRGEIRDKFSSFTYVWGGGMQTLDAWEDFLKISNNHFED